MRFYPARRHFFLLSAATALLCATLSLGDPPTAPSKRPELNRSEKALLEILRKTPRYRYGEIVPKIVKSGTSDYQIGSELTADSLDRVAAHFPDLKKWVEEGKAFRVEYIQKYIQEAQRTVYEQEGLVRSPSQRALRVYYELLRAYNKKKEQEILEQKVIPRARSIIAQRHGYSLASSENSWENEHRKEFYSEVERLRRSTSEFVSRMELPDKIFEAWRDTELKRANSAYTKAQWFVNNSSRGSWNAYFFGLGIEAEIASVTARNVLEAQYASQQEYLSRLEANQWAETERAAGREIGFFGDRAERRGGSENLLKKAEQAWVQDLMWWGHSHSRLEPINPRVAPEFNFWRDRAAVSYRRWGLLSWPGNPDIERVADPESYWRKVGEQWRARYEATKLWTKRAAVTAGVLVGLYAGSHWGLDHGPALFHSTIDYIGHALDGGRLGEHSPSFRPNPAHDAPEGWSSERRVLPGMASDTQRARNDGAHFSRNNPFGDQTLFRIKPGWGADLSHLTEFQLANESDVIDGRPVKPVGVRPSGPSFTIETAVPSRPSNMRYVSLLGVPGYVPSVEVYVDGIKVPQNRDPDVIKEGTFQLKFNPRFDSFWVELPVSVGGRSIFESAVTWRASYYPDPQSASREVSPTRLPDVPYADTAWLIALQRDSGAMAQAEALETVLGDALVHEKPIRPEQIVEIARANTLYSSKPAVEGDEQSPMNPLSRFLPFTNSQNGKREFECDGASNQTRTELGIAWHAVPDIHLSNRTLFVRDPGVMEIRAEDGHARLAVSRDRWNENEVVIFDPTPPERAADSPEPPPLHVLARDSSHRTPSLAELSRSSVRQSSEDGGGTSLLSDLVNWGRRLFSAEASHEVGHSGSSGDATKPSLPAEPPKDVNDHALVFADIARPPITPDRTETRKLREEQLPPEPPGEKLAAQESAAPATALSRTQPTPPRTESTPSRTESTPSLQTSAPVPEVDLDEQMIRREAEAELQARRARNQRRQRMVTELRLFSRQLADFAESIQLNPHDRNMPHNWARRTTRLLADYVEGKFENLEALREAFGKLRISFPEGATTEEAMKNFIKDARARFVRMRAYADEQQAKAEKRKRQYPNSAAFSEPVMSRVERLLGSLLDGNLSPLESTDPLSVLADTRALHRQRALARLRTTEAADCGDGYASLN